MNGYDLEFKSRRDIDDCWSEDYRDRIESDLLWIFGSEWAEVDFVRDLGDRDWIRLRFEAVSADADRIWEILDGHGYREIEDLELVEFEVS